MKAATKTVLASAVVIALCLCAVGGVTYSWFSDTERSDVEITTGTLSVSTSDYELKQEGITNPLETGTSLPANIQISNVVANRTYTISYTVTFQSTVDAVYRVTTAISDIEESQRSYVTTSVSATTTGDSSASADLSDWTTMESTDSPVSYKVTVTVSTSTQFGNGLDASIQHNFGISIVNEIYQGDAHGLIFDSTNQEIRIGSAVELDALADAVNSGAFKTGGQYVDYANYTVILTNDIDLGGVEWTPIGTMVVGGSPDTSNVTGFTGTFDGNNHTISNFVINDATNPAGLFGVVQGTVKDLTVSDVVVNSQQTNNGINGAGAAVGVLWNREFASGMGVVNNVDVVNATVNGSHFIGGVVGYNYGGTIQNCSASDVTVNCVPNVSGDSYDNGDKAGGIVGYLGSGTVTYNTASNVSLTAYRDVGGVVGTIADPLSQTVTVTNNSVSEANILVDQTVNHYDDETPNGGAIIGRDDGITATISGNTSENVTIRVVAESSDVITSALSAGAEVQLTQDLDLTSHLSIDAGATSVIDLNGYDINVTDDHAIVTNGDLTINGEGTVNAGTTATPIPVGGEKVTIFVQGGTLTINGGTFVSNDYQEVVYVSGGKVIINGGTFISNSDIVTAGYLLNVADGLYSGDGVVGTDFIEVHGGTFYDYDPSTGDYGKSSDTFLADGYDVTSSQSEGRKIYAVIPDTSTP